MSKTLDEFFRYVLTGKCLIYTFVSIKLMDLLSSDVFYQRNSDLLLTVPS